MDHLPSPRRPVVLFYNRFFDHYPDTATLPGGDICEFSTDRARLAEADALVIHLPTLSRRHKLLKYPGQLWVAWSMESNVNYPCMSDRAFMRHFDITMTYERAADVWQPYVPRPKLLHDALRVPLPVARERAPAVLIQSASLDRSGRARLGRELMGHIRVDSYGKFLNNRSFGVPDAGVATKAATIARYKFTLAFENAIAPDYVTEKFFHPLLVGSVPVYLGAPNVADFAPGEHCYIDAGDFSGPAELARYLTHLAADDAAYRAYLSWRERDLRPPFCRDLERLVEPAFRRLARLVAARAAGRRRGSPARPFGRLATLRDRFRKPVAKY